MLRREGAYCNSWWNALPVSKKRKKQTRIMLIYFLFWTRAMTNMEIEVLLKPIRGWNCDSLVEHWWLNFQNSGFVPFFRNKFPGFFQDPDWFFKGSKIHIKPYTPKISTLILLTAFHTLHICYKIIWFYGHRKEIRKLVFRVFSWVSQISRTFQDQWPFSWTFQSWKMLKQTSRTFQVF